MHAVRVIVKRLEFESSALVAKHAQILELGVLLLELVVEENFSALGLALHRQEFADALGVSLAAPGTLLFGIPAVLVREDVFVLAGGIDDELGQFGRGDLLH